MPTTTVDLMASAIDYLAVGNWFSERKLSLGFRARNRFELFDLVAPELEERRVLYIEFGVWNGDTTRYWSKLLKRADAALHGFDSFEGLPSGWNTKTPKGQFSRDGNVPVIDDPRITFYKGWFKDTLPTYRLPDHERLFINLDADLYSSTKFVLDYLAPHIKSGTLIYLDEFSNRFHEMRAFSEFLDETGILVEVLGSTETLSNIIFRCTD